MRELEQLLLKAIALYRNILQAFEALECSLGEGEAQPLLVLVENLEQRQSEARVLDQELLSRVEGFGLSAMILPLAREYRDLLEQAAERNRQLLGQARVHQALAASELAELKGGQTALSGYRMPTETRGTVLTRRT